jgi:hypothetical protein
MASFLGQLNEVSVIEGIGLLDQGLVEATLIVADLVTAEQRNGPLLGIEGKERPLLMTGMSRAQLFHVEVLRPLHGVHMRTAELRPELLQQAGILHNADAVGRGQAVEPVLALKHQGHGPRQGVGLYT